jgi:hypothetical protein
MFYFIVEWILIAFEMLRYKFMPTFVEQMNLFKFYYDINFIVCDVHYFSHYLIIISSLIFVSVYLLMYMNVVNVH